MEEMSLTNLMGSSDVDTQTPQQAQVPLNSRFLMDVDFMKLAIEPNASLSEIGRRRSWSGHSPVDSCSISEIPKTKLKTESKFHLVDVHPGIQPQALICCCLMNNEFREQ